MKSRSVAWIAVAAGLLGAGVALWLLLPLPPADDIFAARRFGVGAGYVGFFLGFPLGAVAVPLSVLLHPFPVGEDPSGAAAVAAIIACIVGANWACWAALVSALVREFRCRGNQPAALASRPPD